MASSSSSPASAASPLSVSHNNSLLDWRKMNKQELRDALASRGLDTNGLRPSLIQRLRNSSKTSAEASKETGKSSGTGIGTRPGTEARSGKDAEKSELETHATIISSQNVFVSQADEHRSNFDSSKNSEKQDLSDNVSLSQIATVSKEAISTAQEKNLIPTFDQKKERTSTISHCQVEIQTTQENQISNIQKEEANGNLQDIVNVTGDKEIVSKTTSRTDLDVSLKDASSDSNLAKNGFSKKSFVLNVSSGSSIASLSDLDKKRVRAERFGMGLKISEKEKLAIRAESLPGRKYLSFMKGKGPNTLYEATALIITTYLDWAYYNIFGCVKFIVSKLGTISQIHERTQVEKPWCKLIGVRRSVLDRCKIRNFNKSDILKILANASSLPK